MCWVFFHHQNFRGRQHDVYCLGCAAVLENGNPARACYLCGLTGCLFDSSGSVNCWGPCFAAYKGVWCVCFGLACGADIECCLCCGTFWLQNWSRRHGEVRGFCCANCHHPSCFQPMLEPFGSGYPTVREHVLCPCFLKQIEIELRDMTRKEQDLYYAWCGQQVPVIPPLQKMVTSFL